MSAPFASWTRPRPPDPTVLAARHLPFPPARRFRSALGGEAMQLGHVAGRVEAVLEHPPDGPDLPDRPPPADHVDVHRSAVALDDVRQPLRMPHGEDGEVDERVTHAD